MKKIILGGLMMLILLAACGQKGNLYLPAPSDAPSEKSTPAAAQ